MSTPRSKSREYLREDAIGAQILLAKIRKYPQISSTKTRILLVSLLLAELVKELDCLAGELVDQGSGE